ncbi:hypothetical protein AB0K89_10815 [Streptomyces cinnamoneus]
MTLRRFALAIATLVLALWSAAPAAATAPADGGIDVLLDADVLSNVDIL